MDVPMKELGEICDITLGQSPSSKFYNSDGDGIPFFQGNADFGEDHPTASVWCTQPKKTADVGDVLISVRAPIGAINIADSVCCIGRGLAAIRPHDGLDLNYLRFCLEYNSSKLAVLGTGSTFKAIGKTVLSHFEVPYYSKDVQLHIGKIYTCLKTLMRQTNRMQTICDELIQSRFVEMFGGDDIPQGTLEDVCEAIVDCPHSTPKYDEPSLSYPAIRTSEIRRGEISWTTMRYVGEHEYQKRTSRLIPLPNDIVYSREGTYGNAVLLPSGYSFCLGQRVMLFRANPEICIPAYLLYAILSDGVKNQADRLNSGSTVPHVNVRDAMKFIIPLPPMDLQRRFADFVARVESFKADARRMQERLSTVYDSCAQRYFAV